MSGSLKDVREEYERNREELLAANKNYTAAVAAREHVAVQVKEADEAVAEAATRVRQMRSRLSDSAAKLKPLIDTDVAGLLGTIQLPKEM